MRPVVLLTSYLLLLAPGILGHQLVPRGEEEPMLPPLFINHMPVKEFRCGPRTYAVANYQYRIYEACKRKPSNLWRGPKRYIAPIGKEYSIRGPYYSIPLHHETPNPIDKSRPLDLAIVTSKCKILGMVVPQSRIMPHTTYGRVEGRLTPAKYNYAKCKIVELSKEELLRWQKQIINAHFEASDAAKQAQQQKAQKSKHWWFRGKESVPA